MENQNSDRIYYPGDRRFTPAPEGRKLKSRYDMTTEELNDLQQRSVTPFTVTTLDLAVARTVALPLEMFMPGRGFTIFIEAAGGAPAVGLVNVRVGKNDADYEFPLRNGRGFRGDVGQMYLNWAAQAGLVAKFIVFHFDDIPYPCVT